MKARRKANRGVSHLYTDFTPEERARLKRQDDEEDARRRQDEKTREVVRSLLVRKYKFSAWRAKEAAADVSMYDKRGRTPAEIADYIFCRTGPQPGTVRSLVERVSGVTWKEKSGGTPDPKFGGPRGAFCTTSGLAKSNRAAKRKPRRPRRRARR